MRTRHALVLTTLCAVLLAPAFGSTCDLDGTNLEDAASRNIAYAAALVEWHSRRKVPTAASASSMVIGVQNEAETQLDAARERFDEGAYQLAIAHARSVQDLIEN